MTLKIKITGAIEVHGKQPGDVFDIETDDAGVPLNMLWRKRLADERQFKLGIVTVVPDSPPPPQPQSAASPATPKKEQK